MSRRGAIVIECDRADCHAEAVMPAHEMEIESFKDGLDISTWASYWQLRDGKDVCPHCCEKEDAQ